MTDKNKLIEGITFIIAKYGRFQVSDIDEEPINHANGETIVGFSGISATVIDANGDGWCLPYEDIHEDTLSDILGLCEQWEVECIKTQKRCED
jgi:hypothetical protein